MEVKKTPKANLEGRKSLFFLMGLVVSFSVVFTAFEWGNRELKFQEVTDNLVADEVQDIQVTPPEQETAPPPPAPKPVIVEKINVVDDDKKLEDLEFLSVDDNEDNTPPAYSPPSAGTGRAQEASENDNQIFDFLEEMPEFPGGEAAMMKWLSSHVNYPTIAAENNIQGRVMVSFVVEKDGSVSDVKVVRGVDPSLDREATRVVKAMPKWKPGMQTGKPVRCRFIIPVSFRLR